MQNEPTAQAWLAAMICPFCDHIHDNEDDLYGAPNCLGIPPDDWSLNAPKRPQMNCVSCYAKTSLRQSAPVHFWTVASLKSMTYDDLRQCVSWFLHQFRMCRQKLFKINNLEHLRQCVSCPIYNIYRTGALERQIQYYIYGSAGLEGVS